ncbi:MAG: hypothetical protein GY805_13380 [Chloroflexi bacterium]|nr:hypothetical protein [Chloroflexota bacterium]
MSKKCKVKLETADPNLTIAQGTRLAYAHEIAGYSGEEPQSPHMLKYETDMLVTERLSENEWIPRLIIEAKINRVTTHDAITYSQKATTHKSVHPYLRYGIIIGNRQQSPLPGRLFRHGAYFDFMLSWQGFEPQTAELDDLMQLIKDEVQASRDMQEIVLNTRRADRAKFTYLHRPLVLK